MGDGSNCPQALYEVGVLEGGDEGLRVAGATHNQGTTD